MSSQKSDNSERRVMVIGCQGQLGRELMTHLAESYLMIGVGHAELDITDRDAVDRVIDLAHPAVVILTAANANVDWCEAHPAEAHEINARGAEHIASACRAVGARLVFYSTDYVFDGRKRAPYVETDPPNPISAYGKSKLAGERAVQDTGGDWTILRVSWFYSAHGRSFVRQIVQKAVAYVRDPQNAAPLDVVADQFSNPTWTIDIVNQTHVVIDNALSGLYHSAAVGGSSRPDLARFIFAELGLDIPLREVRREEFPGALIRPEYSSLANSALMAAGHHVMRDFRVALKEFLYRYKTDLLQQ